MQATLFEVPANDNDWQRWSWSHRDSHLRIIQAIAAKGGPALTEYVLDVTQQDFEGFLERNATAHTDMNGAIGAQGAELDELDPKDQNQLVAWIYLHALEHRTAESRLGIEN